MCELIVTFSPFTLLEPNSEGFLYLPNLIAYEGVKLSALSKVKIVSLNGKKNLILSSYLYTLGGILKVDLVLYVVLTFAPTWTTVEGRFA